MTSKLSSSRTGRKLPAVCRPYLLGLPLAYVAGLPTRLSCFALATETSGYDRIADSFPLTWDTVLNHWSGDSGQPPRNIQVIVTPLPAENRFEFELNVRHNDLVIGHFAWDSVHVAPGPPWDSGLLSHHPGPPAAGFEVHVLD